MKFIKAFIWMYVLSLFSMNLGFSCGFAETQERAQRKIITGQVVDVNNQVLVGINVSGVGLGISADKIINRGNPEYSFPRDLTSNARVANYIKFVDWAKAAYNATAEQFSVGKNDQIVLVENLSKYTGFEIRNLVSNGVVWTGIGTGSVNTLPSGSEIVAADGNENILSIGFVLSYGKFDYFTGGDLQYNGGSAHPWKDIEASVAAVVPAVDVMKANHHATAHCNGMEILNSLSPQTVIIHPWRDVHPNPETLNRMFAVNKDCGIFSTNMTEANRIRLWKNIDRLKATHGHIVVRVKPGGDAYHVYVLDDNNEEYKVIDVFGPYQSK